MKPQQSIRWFLALVPTPCSSMRLPVTVTRNLEELPRTASICLEGLNRYHYGGQIAACVGGRLVVDVAFGTLLPTPQPSGLSGIEGVARPVRIPMRRDVVLPWWSVTKPLLTLAVGLAVDSGAMESFDDVVSEHVPEFLYLSNGKGKSNITIAHVLTHTAGLTTAGLGAVRRHRSVPTMMDQFSPADAWRDIVEDTCQAEPEWHVPGSKCGYSVGGAYNVLAEAVLRALRRHEHSPNGDDGRDEFKTIPREEDLANYSILVKRRIFDPLGMSNSFVGMTTEAVQAYRADGRIGATYDMSRVDGGGDGQGHEDDGSLDPASLLGCDPSAGGRGPARELVRLFDTLLNDGMIRLPFIGGDTDVPAKYQQRLLSASSVGEVRRCRYNAFRDFVQGAVLNVGCGTYLRPPFAGRHASELSFGHGGSRCAHAFADPSCDLAVAVLFNGRPSANVHYERARAVSDALYEDLGLA